jgi:hypothetical protein
MSTYPCHPAVTVGLREALAGDGARTRDPGPGTRDPGPGTRDQRSEIKGRHAVDFVNATFLWGLPLAGVPIIVHLLNRRRRNVVPWGAMQFLLEAVAKRRRRWRLDDPLLLALRVAAVLAIVLALAQPRLRAGWFGADGPRDVVIVLDNSLSTARITQEGTVFDALVWRAETLLAQCRDGDRVRILLASEPAEWLTPNAVSISDESRGRLIARLREARSTSGAADMPACLRQAVHAEPISGSAPRVVTVLTDGQAYGWRPEATGDWRTFRTELAACPSQPVVGVLTHEDPAGAVMNLSLESLTPLRSVVSAGRRTSLSASVRNIGARPAETTLVRLTLANEEIAVASLPPLTPGEAASVAFEHVFDRPGVYALTAAVARLDDLPADNSATAVVEVVDEIPTLLVEQGRREPLFDATDYLLAALGYPPGKPAAGHRSMFHPTVVSGNELTPDHLRHVRCVILADVPALPLQGVAVLADFVRAGGGLWILLGGRTDRTFFNDALYANGQGLSPLSLGDPVGTLDDRDRYEIVSPPAANHPATRLLADTQRLDIDRVRVYRRQTLLGEKNQQAVSVLLATSQGAPLVVEKSYGRGRVIVQALPFDVRWNNGPLCQAFVVMAREWLWYLTEPGQTAWNLQPGEPFTARLADEGIAEFADVRVPGGGVLKAASEMRDGVRAFAFTKTLWPGSYEFAVASKGGGRRVHVLPFAVRRDPKESNLARLTDAERQSLVDNGGLRFGVPTVTPTLTGRPSARREPAWSWLLMALLGLMAAESFLAARIGRRRSAVSPGPIIDVHVDVGVGVGVNGRSGRGVEMTVS